MGEKIIQRVYYQTAANFVILLAVCLCCCLSPAHAAQGWERLYPTYPTNGYNDIFALSASNVFAVGASGLIVHYDGSSWSEMQSPVNNTLTAIWGRNGSDIFAVGSGGIILHYNGSKWQVMDNPAQHSIDGNLHCV